MSDNLGQITDLHNITETSDGGFEIPPSRIPDVRAAYDIARSLWDADKIASANRAMLEAMLDGEPPYDPSELKRLGQSQRTNLNFGEASADLESAIAPYNELINNVDRLVSVQTSYGTPEDQAKNNAVIAEEADYTIRSWPDFPYEMDVLSRQFVKHGVGVTFFEDDMNWKFKSAGLEQFKFPRGVKARESAIPIAVARIAYHPHELYNFIRNREAAVAAGWNPEQVLTAIAGATPENLDQTVDYEQIERQLKNNDLWQSFGQARPDIVYTYHQWVPEFDGTVTHNIFVDSSNYSAKNGTDARPQGFMFQKRSRFKSLKSAFTLFTYGIGNGDIHSVRGLLYKIFPHIQLSNRLQCQAVDNSMLSGALLLQPKDAEAVEDMGITFLGAIALLPPQANVVQANIQNTSGSTIPMVNHLTTQRQNNTGGYQSQMISAPGSGERTKFEVQAQLAKESTLSTSAMNLFYTPFEALLTEMLRRLCRENVADFEPGGKEVLDFQKRCLARGVPLDAIYSVKKVTAVRAVGRGSPGQRLMNSQAIMQLLPYMPPQGVNAAIRNIASQILGSTEQVDQYIPRIDEKQLPTQDQKIAEIENQVMTLGTPIQLVEGDNAQHLSIHAPDIAMMTQAAQQGQIEPQRFVQIATMKIQHAAQHLQPIQGDTFRAGMVSQVKQILEEATKLVNQYSQQLEAKAQSAQQKQAQAVQQAMQAQQAPDPMTQLDMLDKQTKIQERQQKMDLNIAKTATNIAKSRQDMNQKGLAQPPQFQ